MLDTLFHLLPRLLAGFWVTIELLVLSALGGVCVGAAMALAGIADCRLLRSISESYRAIFRSIPGLVVLYFIYYGIAQLEIVRSSLLWVVFKQAHWCAWLALSINHGAFTAELLCGALRAVPQDYLQASAALGLRPLKTLWLIRMPIALRLVLPAYTTELIFLTKTTSIVSTITILDLLGTADIIYKETFDPFVPLVTAGLLYLLLISVITHVSTLIESRVFRYPNI
ncbi:ABC transporter permease subunit [Oscillatoria sp. FACHB-1407]|uniref:ABC transporter permease subunit n=1 Tax=Oscillatoria sp. FACHB-1407 TaxID=2692847 RepID=UPI0016880AE2|nr:ABC transporter permease subunit [Oscillatoria sp. FACHB-1407]MBD2463156.1 ABC transporter permease subunit [Oscillatoria sp. FACHB-1407]